MKLTLIRGLPGSGKSTYAKKHYGCLILENDMFLIENGKYYWTPERTKKAINLVYNMAVQALAVGVDVVIANTFTKRSFIESYMKAAQAYGADFEVIRMDNDFGNVHDVPAQTLDKMRTGFEDWVGEKIITY